MKTSIIHRLPRAATVLTLVCLVAACDNDAENNPDLGVAGGGSSSDSDASVGGNDSGGSGGNDSGGSDAGTEPRPDCYENPRTHLEIINACTDAVKIDKTPDLVGLEDDGSLPPLP